MRYLPILLFAAIAQAQTCLPFEKSVTLEGSLSPIDENGYRQWVALTPKHPICTVGDPDDEFASAQQDVTLLQAFPLSTPKIVAANFHKLIGHAVRVRGKLSPASTGYHRTGVLIAIESVEPVDARGQAALRAPERAPSPIQDVAAYDVEIHAGEHLRKQVTDPASHRRLEPADSYAPHWVTGGDVVYLNCRDGYRMEPGAVTPPDAAQWEIPLENTCAFNVQESGEIVIRLRCVRRN